MRQTTGLLCYFRAECKRAVGGGCFAPIFCLGKAQFPFPSWKVALPCTCLPFSSGTASVSLILTNKGKTSKVTREGMETSPPQVPWYSEHPSQHPKKRTQGRPGVSERGCKGRNPPEAPGRDGVRSDPHPRMLPAASHLRGVLALLGSAE